MTSQEIRDALYRSAMWVKCEDINTSELTRMCQYKVDRVRCAQELTKLVEEGALVKVGIRWRRSGQGRELIAKPWRTFPNSAIAEHIPPRIGAPV